MAASNGNNDHRKITTIQDQLPSLAQERKRRRRRRTRRRRTTSSSKSSVKKVKQLNIKKLNAHDSAKVPFPLCLVRDMLQSLFYDHFNEQLYELSGKPPTIAARRRFLGALPRGHAQPNGTQWRRRRASGIRTDARRSTANHYRQSRRRRSGGHAREFYRFSHRRGRLRMTWVSNERLVKTRHFRRCGQRQHRHYH